VVADNISRPPRPAAHRRFLFSTESRKTEKGGVVGGREILSDFVFHCYYPRLERLYI
jgi:hypothetical protein